MKVISMNFKKNYLERQLSLGSELPFQLDMGGERIPINYV